MVDITTVLPLDGAVGSDVAVVDKARGLCSQNKRPNKKSDKMGQREVSDNNRTTRQWLSHILWKNQS